MLNTEKMNVVSFNAIVFCILFATAAQRINSAEPPRHDFNCGKPCKGPRDCSSSQNCTICASRNYGGVNVGGKICMTEHEMTCGGPPLPPQKSSLPQYLVIGDFITRGYFRNLKNRVKKFAEAFLNTGTPKTSADGVKCIDVWLGPDPNRWDVISFNFGSKDIEANVDISTYQVNLKNFSLAFNNTKATNNRRVIFAFTTPTANSPDCCSPNDRSLSTTNVCPRLIEEYNAEASEIMKRLKIKVDNLWEWVNLHCCNHTDCQYNSCDFQPSPPSCPVGFDGADGWDYLATNVSKTVEHILKPQH